MNKTKTYYQPLIYTDDGTNIDWELPCEIHSFMAFASEEDCKTFMDDCGYKEGEYKIEEYHDEDIEGVTIIDEEGMVVEVNEEEESDLLTTLKDWAERLQYDYENSLGCDGSNVTYYSFADSAKDFIDAFLNYADEL